ncbi:MAG: hypothetical protein U5M51_12505 [Emticicia sp.]|nr:hypothetical protein [Emticicia sp.]
MVFIVFHVIPQEFDSDVEQNKFLRNGGEKNLPRRVKNHFDVADNVLQLGEVADIKA